MSDRRLEMQEGFEVGAIIGGLLILALLALVVPTNEFRARLWFLLENPRDPSLDLALAGILSLGGVLGLAGLRALSRWRVAGVGAAAAAHVAALGGGAWRWVPEFGPPAARAAVMLLGGGAALVVILRARRGISSRRGVGTPRDTAV